MGRARELLGEKPFDRVDGGLELGIMREVNRKGGQGGMPALDCWFGRVTK